MEDPVHVTLNTSASAMSPCVDITGPNRLCACKAVPVLRTGFSKDLPEQLQCSEKGGEIDTRHKLTSSNAVRLRDRSIASRGVIPTDTIMSTTSSCLSSMTEVREESQQLNPIQIQGTITEDTPVALRTRRSRQQTVPIRTKDDGGDLFQATKNQNKDNELIKQLKAKIMDQENTISELSSAMESFLKIQPIVKKLQGNIAKISKQVDTQKKFEATVSKIDPEIVKPFTPSKNSMDKAENQTAMENQTMSALKARYNVIMMRPDIFGDEIAAVTQAMLAQSNKELKEAKCNKRKSKRTMDDLRCQDDQMKSSTSDKKPHCRRTRADTSERTTTSEKRPSKHLACMTTPKKRLKDTSIDSDGPEEYNSASEECDSEIVDETALSSPAQSDQNDLESESGSQLSQTGRGYGSEDTESESRLSPPPRERRKKSNGNFRGEQDKNTRYKKDSFVPDKAPKDKRDAAIARIKNASARVTDKVHRSRKNRATETLYVGNLAFNTTEEDLSAALEHHLGPIVVENVTIPCVNGKSKYGFIELSWAQATMLDIDDIMTYYSGVLKVNERRIYLRELRDKGNKQ